MRILTVVDYDEMWPTLFENERTLLQMTLGKVISRIHHIGSTSVPGLSAKPVIDILIEVANLEELDSLNQAMEGVGYTVRGENGILNRRYFTKGGNQRSIQYGGTISQPQRPGLLYELNQKAKPGRQLPAA